MAGKASVWFLFLSFSYMFSASGSPVILLEMGCHFSIK